MTVGFLSRARTGKYHVINTNLLTYLRTYLLTTRNIVLLVKLTGFQPFKKFPALYGTSRFNTSFTSARHHPVHKPTSHFLKILLNIILPSTPGSPRWFLYLKFPHQNPVCLSSPLTRYLPHPCHSSRFYLPNKIG